jgi:hypothetical protein
MMAATQPAKGKSKTITSRKPTRLLATFNARALGGISASQNAGIGLKASRPGVPLFLMQFSGIATPSIQAGFRPVPTRNPHKINHLLTGPFPASTDTDRRMGLTAGKGGKPSRNRVGRDGRMTPRSRRPGDVCRWCAYRGPRGIWSLVQPSGPLSKQIGYAVRHCEGESDRNAAVGMSRCA